MGAISILLIACQTTTATPKAKPDPFSDFARCPGQPGGGATDWMCSTLDVPLDRANPAAGTIPLAIYILRHTDRTAPSAEPVFAIPGGPGVDAYDNGSLYSIQPELLAHHDIVTIDPRGSGHSDAIDCPDLQRGPTGSDQWDRAVAACASLLVPPPTGMEPATWPSISKPSGTCLATSRST